MKSGFKPFDDAARLSLAMFDLARCVGDEFSHTLKSRIGVALNRVDSAERLEIEALRASVRRLSREQRDLETRLAAAEDKMARQAEKDGGKSGEKKKSATPTAQPPASYDPYNVMSGRRYLKAEAIVRLNRTQCPKQPGSKAAARWARYIDGASVKDNRKGGVRAKDIAFDLERGFIALLDPEGAPGHAPEHAPEHAPDNHAKDGGRR